MEQQRIYIVQKNGECYGDAYHYIIGLWPTFDEAMKQAKETCVKYRIDESKLPMSFDEYLSCNSGYPDDPWETDMEHEYTHDENVWLNTRIDRDGHTAAEFEEVSNAWDLSMDDFSNCDIEEFLIGVPYDNNVDIKVKQSVTYVSNDPNYISEFLINTY